MKRGFWFILCLICCVANDLPAQPAGLDHYQIWRDTVAVASIAGDPGEELALIVRFEQPPLLQSKPGASKSSRLVELRAEHARFSRDLINLGGVNDAITIATVQREYFQVFNGASVRIRRGLVRHLAALPYVAGVYVDGEVFTQAYQLASQRRTRSTASLDGTGRGVRIAVIDTGIDYTHQDLGGGFGAGYKVVGGYDFVNDDPDPLDDNGHGTHVAGIAAARGFSFQGLAPDAELLAYKVLDASGFGRDSWVLAAIERALDPDGDPDTDDGADIINLSLGGPAGGDARHPVTLAVDEAVRAGVVCVVAAGNSGQEGFATISAPGNALSAITVGAARVEGVAPFSGRGPTGAIHTDTMPRFGMKPDLTAPGVAIESTWPAGGYEVLNGTSMATPHVAGMAARLLELKPDWTPGRIKAALMQSARDLGLDRRSQGAGMLDSLSVLPAAVVEPASMSLGLIEGSEPVNLARSLLIHNENAVSQSYRLEVTGNLPPGLEVRIHPQEVNVVAGGRASLDVWFELDPAIIPNIDFPGGYMGAIKVVGASVVEVPFSFFKTSHGRLEIDGPVDFTFIHGSTAADPITLSEPASSTFLLLPADTYNIIAEFDGGERTVIREEVRLDNGEPVYLSAREAVHEIKLRPVDRAGAALRSYSGAQALKHGPSGFTLVKQGDFLSMASDLPEKLYFSTTSEAYRIDLNLAGFDAEGNYYEIPFTLSNGIDRSILLQNDPADFRQINYRNLIPAGIERVLFIPWTSDETDSDSRLSMSVRLDTSPNSPFWLYAPFEKNIFLAPTASSDFRWKKRSFTLHTEEFSLSRLLTGARNVTLFQSGSAEYAASGPAYVGERPLADAFSGSLGAHFVHWAGRLDVSSTRIRMLEGHNGGYFLDEWGGLRPGGLAYTLYRDGKVIREDSVYNTPRLPVRRDPGAHVIDVAPGAYRLVLENDLEVAGVKRRAEAELLFKTDRADASPPQLAGFYIETAGMPAERFEPGHTYEIIAAIHDECETCSREELRNVAAWKRALSDTSWKPLIVETTPTGIRAELGGLEAGEDYALRLAAEDASGNRLTYSLTPAIEVAGWRTPRPLEPESGATVSQKRTQLVWHAVNETVSYRVQVAADSAFVDVLEERAGIDGVSVSLSALPAGRPYFWRVRPESPDRVGAWSNPAWFIVDALDDRAENEEALPSQFSMSTPYPNPTRGGAMLEFELPVGETVTVDIYDALGRRAISVVNEWRPAGRYRQYIDLSIAAAGVYFVHLRAGEFSTLQRLVRVD